MHHRHHVFPGVFKPCATCRGGIYKGHPSYLWYQDNHFIRVCDDCDKKLMQVEWYERQCTIESIINSLALDRFEFVLK